MMGTTRANHAAGTLLHILLGVIARESGRSSIPEAIAIYGGASGILDRPIESGDDTE
jgi:hypothetical protein